MIDFLTSIEFWTVLALFAMVAIWVLGRGSSKHMEDRIKRVTTPREQRAAAQAQASLRKRDPDADSKLGQAIEQFNITDRVRSRMEMAGMVLTPQQLLIRAAGLFLAGMLGMLLLGKPLSLAAMVALLLGLGGPNMYISRRIKKRKKRFIMLFPDAIELIVRGLRAGLPVAESFQTVSREIAVPVGDVFALVSQQIALGVPMEKALTDIAKKLNLTEFDFFVTTIILQRETGGNLGEILSNLAEVLRQRRMMKLKIGAISSEARASAYIVGSLPFIVFIILNVVSPDYVEPLYSDFRGNIALACGCFSLTCGALIMRKMTQFEI